MQVVQLDQRNADVTVVQEVTRKDFVNNFSDHMGIYNKISKYFIRR